MLVIIDTKAYILRMTIATLFYYVTFFSIYREGTIKKKLILFFIFFPCTFLANIFTGFADILPVFSSYLFLKRKHETDYFLLSTSVLSMLIDYVSSILSSSLMLYFVTFEGIKGIYFILIELIIQGLILLIMLCLYRHFKLGVLLKKNNSGIVALLLCYLFLVTLTVSYAAHYYEAFDKFIVGIATFLIVQTVFVLLVFTRAYVKQKEKYERELEQQQLESLKKYTDQLEQNQMSMAKFKHDYKNLLLSLREAFTEAGDREALQQIEGLEHYSNQHFLDKDLNYHYCKNIENPYLKSLVITKLFEANEQKVDCHFECLSPIQEIPIPIFDCIRLAGIALDNAIEAARESAEHKVSIMFHQDKRQTEIFIENSCVDVNLPVEMLMKQGISTKIDHEGLGLSNIREIERRNPNILIQFKKNRTKFSIQMILMGK